MFNFAPKSDQELLDLLKDGEAQYIVVGAKVSTSQSGNEMLTLDLKVMDSTGKEKEIKDFLVESESMRWKIKNFCYSCGLENQYDHGRITINDLKERTGKLIIKTTPATGKYRAKSSVDRYITHEKSGTDNFPFDDSLPFN